MSNEIYAVGSKVCLWQEKMADGKVTVLKEVIVTITERKTGVPGEFSRKPVSSKSLRGIGDDGKVYEKHWESWPESQTDCFTDRWSMRDDGEGEYRFWAPKEAVHSHTHLKLALEAHPGLKLVRVDKDGQPIVPKGDVVYCTEHDEYAHVGTECWQCYFGKLGTKIAV